MPTGAGATSAVASSTSISFLEGKEQAAAVTQMYRDAGIQLSPQCDLPSHIAAAAEVSDRWLSGTLRNPEAHIAYIDYVSREANSIGCKPDQVEYYLFSL